jgi:hypothetical protein
MCRVLGPLAGPFSHDIFAFFHDDDDADDLAAYGVLSTNGQAVATTRRKQIETATTRLIFGVCHWRGKNPLNPE